MSNPLPSGSRPITLCVNGQNLTAHAEPRVNLADFLRHDLGLTGTHVGCEHGVCGACTIIVDGEPARGCLMLAVQAQGAEVITVEGVSPPTGLSPIQQAMREHHGLQCGFCTPGLVMTMEAWLKDNSDPDETAIRAALSGHLCRCTGYQSIVAAVKRAARIARERA